MITLYPLKKTIDNEDKRITSFKYEEKVNFFIGLNTFRESNFIFRDIVNCDALGFNNPNQPDVSYT